MTKCHFHQLFVGFLAQNLAESIAEKLFQTLKVETYVMSLIQVKSLADCNSDV
jgi:hypothetical protein